MKTMRDTFFDELYDIFKKDKDAVLLSGDLGAPSLDKFKGAFNNIQYFNVGISEQNMITLAAGLALEGKKVFVYTIAPFISLRCYEQIKLDLCYMNLPVVIVANGAGLSYSTSGPTHHAIEDIALMRVLPNMSILNPSDNVMVAHFAKECYKHNKGPIYIRLDRDILPNIYNKTECFKAGLSVLKSGDDITIIASGIMSHRALDITRKLYDCLLDTTVIDLYRVKPVDNELLLNSIESKYVVTLEENHVSGGIGSIVAEIISGSDRNLLLKRIGIVDNYYLEYNGRQELQKYFKLDVDNVIKEILEWI